MFLEAAVCTEETGGKGQRLTSQAVSMTCTWTPTYYVISCNIVSTGNKVNINKVVITILSPKKSNSYETMCYLNIVGQGYDEMHV